MDSTENGNDVAEERLEELAKENTEAEETITGLERRHRGQVRS